MCLLYTGLTVGSSFISFHYIQIENRIIYTTYFIDSPNCISTFLTLSGVPGRSPMLVIFSHHILLTGLDFEADVKFWSHEHFTTQSFQALLLFFLPSNSCSHSSCRRTELNLADYYWYVIQGYIIMCFQVHRWNIVLYTANDSQVD